MSYAIKHGLFKLNITDYHAILGVSIDADAKEVRLRYLKIAQKLHPDKCKSAPAHKKLSGQILSKLVNPAYEQLSRKNSFAEHQLILTQIGKRLAENKSELALNSQQAQTLLKSGDRVELTYLKQLKELAAEQYKSLDQVTEAIAIISELNLVYLMLRYRHGINREKPKSIPQQPAAQKTSKAPKSPISQASSSPTPSKKADEPTPQSRVASYIRRSEQYISRQDFAQAIIELREALKIDPNNSTCHALLGKAYLKQQQLTMAKVHINKAYKANSQDPIVIESKKELEKLLKTQNKSQAKSRNSGSKSEDKSTNSGFFSGFFGAKKK